MLSDRGRADGGFTLVELLVVLVIFGVVGGFVTATIVSALQTSRRAEARIHALNDLQRGIERVGRELRAASPLLLDENKDFNDGVAAQVVRGGERILYEYYLVDTGDSVELREDVTRRNLDGDLISEQQGLFIADIANLETGTPLFTYFITDPATGAIREIDCDDEGLGPEECLNKHLTATQIRLTLEKVLPEAEPIRVETIVNIRNTRFVPPEDE